MLKLLSYTTKKENSIKRDFSGFTLSPDYKNLLTPMNADPVVCFVYIYSLNLIALPDVTYLLRPPLLQIHLPKLPYSWSAAQHIGCERVTYLMGD